MSATRLQVQLIGTRNIRADHELQSRVGPLHTDYVHEFSDAILRGDMFPPVDVFWDGETYWLADGFHRYEAHKKAHVADLRCTIHYGTRRDAIIFSAGANKQFSIRRTDADKKHAAAMLFGDDEWFAKSADLIGRHVGVKGSTIKAWRDEYCKEHHRRPPAKVVTERGTVQTAKPRKPGEIWRDSNKAYWFRNDGKNVQLQATNRSDARYEAYEIRNAQRQRQIDSLLEGTERSPRDIAVARAKVAKGDPIEFPQLTVDKLYTELRDNHVRAHHFGKKWGICSYCCIEERPVAVVVCLRYARFDHQRIQATDDPQSIAEAIGNLALLQSRYARENPAIRLIVATADHVDPFTVDAYKEATSSNLPIKIEFMTPAEIVDAFRRGPVEEVDR